MTQVIGIVGGVASGKSLVSKQLEQLGAKVLDADRIGHEVLCMPEVKQALVTRWGEQVLDAEGEIDRRVVARIVFGPAPDGPQELNFLEEITHPRIEQRLREQIEEHAKRGKIKAVVLDAALLLEAGWEKMCDKIVFVDSPQEERLARAISRGWSREDFAAREAAQISVENKRKKADYFLDNSGTEGEIFRQVKEFWDLL